RRHTRSKRDWSSDVCSSDLLGHGFNRRGQAGDPLIQEPSWDGGEVVLFVAGHFKSRASWASAFPDTSAAAKSPGISVVKSAIGEIGRASCRETVCGAEVPVG